MGQSEFTDWIEYYNVEPFGEVREEQRNSLIASILANINRDRKVKHEPYDSKDFMYLYEDFNQQNKVSKDIPLIEKFKMIATVQNYNVAQGKD